jgi:hypothetical protein
MKHDYKLPNKAGGQIFGMWEFITPSVLSQLKIRLEVLFLFSKEAFWLEE